MKETNVGPPAVAADTSRGVCVTLTQSCRPDGGGQGESAADAPAPPSPATSSPPAANAANVLRARPRRVMVSLPRALPDALRQREPSQTASRPEVERETFAVTVDRGYPMSAGCPAGGLVLDPFGGAGTTGLVADRHGRGAILIELNPKYVEMARKRIKGDAPMFAEVSA